MKYAACSFKDEPGAKTYDYAIPDGIELNVGDVVRVPAPKNADGYKKVYVVEVKDEPSMPVEWIKPIIEIHTEEEGETV